MAVERALILRGAIVGALAGLLTFVFSLIFVEPQIEAAIDYESTRAAAEHSLVATPGVSAHADEAELFSRSVQANFGLGLGMILFGVAMGALVAVVFRVLLGRVGRLGHRPLALLVAGAGLLTVFLLPFLKYPANPPAVGSSDTIGSRGSLYLLMVAASVLVLAGAVWLGRGLAARFGNWNASMVAGAAFIVATGILMTVMPSFAETPLPLRDADGSIVVGGFPGDVLADFRMYSIAAQILLWSAIGLLFGPLAERVLARGNTRSEDRIAVG